MATRKETAKNVFTSEVKKAGRTIKQAGKFIAGGFDPSTASGKAARRYSDAVGFGIVSAATTAGRHVRSGKRKLRALTGQQKRSRGKQAKPISGRGTAGQRRVGRGLRAAP